MEKVNKESIKEHLDACMKLHTQNKLSTKNAWMVNIIDSLKSIIESENVTTDIFQIATSSLEVGAKVYGLRVDDVYQEVIQLLSSVRRKEAKSKPEESGDEEGCEESEKKSKRKKNLAANRATVVSNINSITSKPEVVDLSYIAADQTTSDKLLSFTLEFVGVSQKLSLSCDEKHWIPSNLPLNWMNDKVEIDLPKIESEKLLPQILDFNIYDWSPDNDKKSELENSILEFERSFQENPAQCSFIGDQIFQAADFNDEEKENRDFKPSVMQVIDFTHGMSAQRMTEYTYNKLILCDQNQIWAGPSHWKIKTLRQITASQFQSITTRNKREKLNDVIDFSLNVEIPKVEKVRHVKTCDYHRITLPVNMRIDRTRKYGLMLKPLVKLISENILPSESRNSSDANIFKYDFENLNDSINYCSEICNEANDGENNCAEEMVEAPHTVPKSTLTYALKSKKVDMKLLKQYIFRELKQSEVKELKLSSICASIPSKLPERMAEETSLALQISALLHLANEHNLELRSEGLENLIARITN